MYKLICGFAEHKICVGLNLYQGGFNIDVDAQLKKGILEVCVLAALRQEESYGYKIITDISPYIEISESTLYPILKRLESFGYVTTRAVEHNGRLRKYYMITSSGRNRIREFVLDLREISRVYDFICREDYIL